MFKLKTTDELKLMLELNQVKNFLATIKHKKSSNLKKQIIALAIDYKLDESFKDPTINDRSSNGLENNGLFDYINPFYDFEDKVPSKLDFGTDYTDDTTQHAESLKDEKMLGFGDGVSQENEDHLYEKDNSFSTSTP